MREAKWRRRSFRLIGAPAVLAVLLPLSLASGSVRSLDRDDVDRATTGPRIAGQHPAYLPDASCAFADSPTDDATHALHPPGTPEVKVIYAHPADTPNQAAEYYPGLAQAVRDMMEYVYLGSGDRKSIRFDLGTFEAPDCVDIQRVSLPRPTAYYVPPAGTLSSTRLRNDLTGLLGPQPSPRNFLVYLPSILNRQAGGFAAVPNDDSVLGAEYQDGGRFAFVFNFPPTREGQQHAAQEGAHEVFHNLGAIQASAPNSDGQAHCNDGTDLMCFAGARCGQLRAATTSITLPLDCGADDYFNPTPPAGSYLATHWNTYNSPFLCETGTCVPDNLGPVIGIKGKRRTSDSTPRFRLSADEDAVRIRCRIDAARFHRCGRRVVAPELDPGEHVLRAVARDRARNRSPKPARFRFRVRG